MVTSTYTERQPCAGVYNAKTNTTKNCTELIENYMPNANVTYSFDFMEQADAKNTRDAIKSFLVFSFWRFKI